jgi:diacylglycerol kinase family enzyme
VERVLLVANAHAGSVSARVKEVIVKALSADFKLDNVETSGRNHATELARDAVDRGFDAVLTFGGDGTINEVAQGLVGTDVALGIIPGGSTNVAARSLGIPPDPVEATAFVAQCLSSGRKRRINVGQIADRYFLFSTGMGLDAEVVRQYESHPEWKNESFEWNYIKAALRAGSGKYRKAEPSITVEIPGEKSFKTLLAICCNGRPFTYYKRWPVDICPQAQLDKGLDVFALDKIRLPTIPRIIWSIFVSRSHIKWRRGHYIHDIEKVVLSTDEPMPVQVDGDYIGEFASAEVVLQRDALDLLV